jgi:hypothetical protein
MAKRTSPSQFVNLFFKEVDKKGISREQLTVAHIFFENIKTQLINRIINDPVTQELINHPDPSPILGGIHGTLFGFLGLPAGSDPVAEIISIINRIMVPKVSRRLVRGGVKVSTKIPELSDFRTKTLQMPWEGGGGIVDGIEKGVSGLHYYLYPRKMPARSVSQEGIQSKNPVRARQFQSRPWLTPILKSFKDEMKKFR